MTDRPKPLKPGEWDITPISYSPLDLKITGHTVAKISRMYGIPIRYLLSDEITLEQLEALEKDES